MINRNFILFSWLTRRVQWTMQNINRMNSTTDQFFDTFQLIIEYAMLQIKHYWWNCYLIKKKILFFERIKRWEAHFCSELFFRWKFVLSVSIFPKLFDSIFKTKSFQIGKKAIQRGKQKILRRFFVNHIEPVRNFSLIHRKTLLLLSFGFKTFDDSLFFVFSIVQFFS